MGVENIGLEAILKDADFKKGISNYIKSVSSANRKTDKATKGISKSFVNTGKGILKFSKIVGKALVLGVGAGVAALGALAVFSTKAAVSVESAFAGVIKTTDGLVDEFGNLTEVGEELKTGFRELSKEIPISVEELMGIGELGGQLGIAKEDLLEFTEAIAAVGVSTNITTEEGAKQFAQFANIMGTVSREGSAAFEKIGSTIVDLGNNFATTEVDILNFGSRIAGAGKIAGLTEANIFAIATAFTSVGVEAEAGGTAVQKVLLAMTQAVVAGVGTANEEMVGIMRGWVDQTGQSVDTIVEKFLEGGEGIEEFANDVGVSVDEVGDVIAGLGSQTAEDLKNFAEVAGVSADEFVELWEVDAAGAFQLFVEGLGEQGEDAIKTLQDLGLEDQRLVRSFLSMAGAGELLGDAIDLAGDAWEENSALAKEAGQRYATTESQMKILKNVFKDVGVTIGSALLPFINKLIKMAKPLIDKFGKKLADILEKKVMPALERVAKWLGENIPNAIKKAKAFWEDTLMPALQSFWVMLQDNVFPVIQKLVEWLGEVLPKVIQWLVDHWEGLKSAIIAMGAVLAAAGIIGGIIAIATAIGALLNPIGLLVAAVGLLAFAWAEDWMGIRTALTDFWDKDGRRIFEDIKAWLEVNIPLAIETVKKWWQEKFLPALQNVWAFIQDVLIPIFQAVTKHLAENIPLAIEDARKAWDEKLYPALYNAWSFIAVFILPIFATLGMWLAENIPVAVEASQKAWDEKLFPALRNTYGFIFHFLIPIFQIVWKWLSFFLVNAIAIAKNWLEKKLIPALSAVWAFITTVLIPVLKLLWVWINIMLTGAIGTLMSKFTELTNFDFSILDTIKGMFKGIVDMVQMAINKVVGLANKIAALQDRTITITTILKTIRKGGGVSKGGDDEPTTDPGTDTGPDPKDDPIQLPGGIEEYAAGGILQANRFGVVGDKGPEIISTKRSIRIFPNKIFQKFGDFLREIGKIPIHMPSGVQATSAAPISTTSITNNNNAPITIQTSGNPFELREIVRDVLRQELGLNR